jgi:hypothetical protein
MLSKLKSKNIVESVSQIAGSLSGYVAGFDSPVTQGAVGTPAANSFFIDHWKLSTCHRFDLFYQP